MLQAHYKSFLFALILGLTIVVTDTLAASRKLTISMVTGDVTFKRGKRKAKPVRKSSRLKVKDIIFTGSESKIELRLENGTRFTIEENSEVHLSVFKIKGKITNSKLRIQTGKIIFNVKKLASKKSDFRFETPTASAAIRGTEGGIGSNGDKSYAYLSEGSLELIPIGGGSPVTINGMDVAVQTPLGFDVKQVKDQSELNNLVSQIENTLAEESEKKSANPAKKPSKSRAEKKKSKATISTNDGTSENESESDGQGENQGPTPGAGGSGDQKSVPTQEELDRFKEELNAPNELEESDLLEIPIEEINVELEKASPSQPKTQH